MTKISKMKKGKAKECRVDKKDEKFKYISLMTLKMF